MNWEHQERPQAKINHPTWTSTTTNSPTSTHKSTSASLSTPNPSTSSHLKPNKSPNSPSPRQPIQSESFSRTKTQPQLKCNVSWSSRNWSILKPKKSTRSCGQGMRRKVLLRMLSWREGKVTWLRTCARAMARNWVLCSIRSIWRISRFRKPQMIPGERIIYSVPLLRSVVRCSCRRMSMMMKNPYSSSEPTF